MKCRCGCTTFYAEQHCRGSVTIVVDENGVFLRNATHFDESCLDFDDPEPPFICTKCNCVLGQEQVEVGF